MNQLAKWGARRGFCSSLAVAGGVEGRGRIRGEGASLQEKCPSGERLRAGVGCAQKRRRKKSRSGPDLGRRTTRAQPPTRPICLDPDGQGSCQLSSGRTLPRACPQWAGRTGKQSLVHSTKYARLPS